MNKIDSSIEMISVVINCYNGSQFLKECIDSVLIQTHQYFEIIFWDNQSEDCSKQIIESYNDTRIKYFYSPRHTSLYEARNLAISKCKGKYVTFIDCDDIWLQNKLSLQIDIFRKFKINCLGSNFFIKEGNTEKIAYKKMLTFQKMNNVLTKYQIGFITLMIDLDFLKKNKILFNSDYKLIGDFDFILKILNQEDIFLLSQPTCKYRKHKNNLSKSNINIKVNEYERLYKKLKDYNFSNSELLKFKQYFNYELFKYDISYKNYYSAINNFLFKTNILFFIKSIVLIIFSFFRKI